MLTNATDPAILYLITTFAYPWYKKGGSGLNMVVQSLPPEQFTVTTTVAALDKLEYIQEGAVARYGPVDFRWMSTVGDMSAMYDEIDP